MEHVLKLKRLSIAPPEGRVNVGIGRNDAGGFALAARIEVVFTGVDQATADEIAAQAHLVCPYSNATRGNVDVQVTAKVA